MSAEGHPAARVARRASPHVKVLATLNPYDVIVLAAVEAVNEDKTRQAPASTGEVSLAAQLSGQATLACLEGSLLRQGLVERQAGLMESAWLLTGTGQDCLRELIRREYKGRPRSF